MNPHFSIIIPHYNIPDLLMRCLKSIPVSEDIQVIVVDDNSLDSDTYLDRYPELSRPYLEFIRTTKGGGAGYARNVGLEHAKGKWLLFVDADDFYVENMYEIILSCVETNADVIYFKAKSCYSDDIDKTSDRHVLFNNFINDYLRTGNDEPIRANHTVLWGKMIQREFVEHHCFRFDEIKYSNDVLFSVHVGCCANCIKVINTPLYVVTWRPGSLTSLFCSKPGELAIRTEVTFQRHKYLNQNNFVFDEMPFDNYLIRLLGKDKRLFNYYFKRKVKEIYPSRRAAYIVMTKGRGLKFKVKLLVYILIIYCIPFISNSRNHNSCHVFQ